MTGEQLAVVVNELETAHQFVSPAKYLAGLDKPEPAVPAWAPGLDGVGPHLTGADAEPVR